MVDEVFYFVPIIYIIIFGQDFCNTYVGDGAQHFAKTKFKIKSYM
jgi:hypothetical protein